MKTTKPPKQSRQYSVEFVTPLSLETCLRRLQRYDRSGANAHAKRIDDDTYIFEVWAYRKRQGDKQGYHKITGYLQRWNENAVIVRGGIIDNYRFTSVMTTALALVVTACIATPLIAFAGLENISPLAWGVWLAFIAIAIVVSQSYRLIARANTTAIVRRVFGDVGFRPESYDSRLDPLNVDRAPKPSAVDMPEIIDKPENYVDEKRQLRDSSV